jgi:hypothetical membrane protein
MAAVSVPTSGVKASSETTFLRVAAICAIAAQVAFVALWIVWGFLEDHYDVTRQDISDFGALDATHPLPYNIILSITGALTVPLAVALFMLLKPRLAGMLGILAVATFGVGEFLDGLLREDCSPSGNAACRAAVDAGDVSWHHTAHDIESLVTIASMIIAPLALAFVFRNRPRWRDLSWYSVFTVGIVLAFVIVYGAYFAANDGSEINGLLERGAAFFGVLWIAVVAWRVWRLSGEDRAAD